MHIERNSAHEFTTTGNIKTTADYLEIRKMAMALVDDGSKAIQITILDSLSMPSSVIGFFVKLVNRDKIRLTMAIQDPRLLELLEELGLTALFGAHLKA